MLDIDSIKNTVIQGNNLDVLPTLPDNSVDAIVTDPPYGLSFMGKKRDYDVPSQKLWEECLRVLKPGGYLLAFAGTRTQHRMAVRIEDAGFEIRDMIAWVYGSGFPKSLNIGKQIDKMQGNEREIVGETRIGKTSMGDASGWDTSENMKAIKESGSVNITKGTSEREGRGTALKPALEPITVARKPLSEKTVAENVLKWGTGGINIDESRVGYEDKAEIDLINKRSGKATRGLYEGGFQEGFKGYADTQGRFPANIIHDNSEEVRECFPETHPSGNKAESIERRNAGKSTGANTNFSNGQLISYEDESNNASRFFKSIIYQAKASKSERNMGCEEIPIKDPDHRSDTGKGSYVDKGIAPQSNSHPTVKPIALMEYLVKLVSKEGSIVLDPFAGSGSTLIACKKIDRQYIGIEMTPEYIPIIEARLNAVVKEEPEEDLQPSLF